jgi:Cdc6-like AAA superfamily ATPase
LSELIKDKLCDESKRDKHKIIVIDEIDNFSQRDRARQFLDLLHIILKAESNTTIIGIANSVELLNRVFIGSKKELTLVEKKLIFEPYIA